MNKKMREIKTKIQKLLAEAKSLMDGENKDVAKANELMEQAKTLKSEYDTEKAIYDAEKFAGVSGTENPDTAHSVTPDEASESKSAAEKFAEAAKAGFPKSMSEGTPADGGYTVPEDIETTINELREAKYSLLDEVTVVTVTTNKGRRTYKKRTQQTGFTKVGESGKIPAKDTPQFSILEYEIEKYAGYFPVTDELLEDSAENITGTLTEWIADESRVTANKLILAEIDKKFDTVTLSGLDDIKKQLNVTLGQAFKPTSKIYTNDDGLQYLDTLKDSDGNYLLQPNPADPMQLRLCAGATIIPISVIPNTDCSSAPAYSATNDTTVKSGKTYYSKGEDGSYTAVETPETNPKTSGYYENVGSNVPMMIGDMKEAVVYHKRKGITIKASDVASVTGINAYEQDMTLWRAIEREDVVIKDDKALVNGRITITA